MLNETKEIGYISKVHGYKGDVLLNLIEGYELDVEEGDFLFLIHHDKPVPYLIERIAQHRLGLILHFEDVSNEDLAKRIVGTTVHAETDQVFLEEDFIDYSVLEGFEIEDQNKGRIGKIVNVIDNGPNIILELDFNGKEIMLPYTEELIVKMDEENKVIHYNAPAGLIDMYLE